MKKVRYGILATGWIAEMFAGAFRAVPEAELVAVGSRSLEKAREFAGRWGIERAYGSYEELAADPEIDIIYIATPHSHHYDNIMLCLSHNKSVLCEKAFTVSKAQAQRAIDEAKKRGLFLMEAMWTRFNPTILEVQRLVKEGAIGDVRAVSVVLSQHFDENDRIRLFEKSLAGGSLLDMGVYVITGASLMLGTHPKHIETAVHYGPYGTDEQVSYLFEYEDGRMATMMTGLRFLNRHYQIMGTEGVITVPMFPKPQTATIERRDGTVITVNKPFDANGYEYELRHTVACLQQGLTESPVMTHSLTLEVMGLMDEIRRSWGFTYPQDDPDFLQG